MKLICLHGLGQTISSYDDLKYYLLPHIEVEVLELPKESDFKKLQGKLLERLKQEESSFVLFGLYLGGVLALSLVNYLEKCKGIIISGAQYQLKGHILFRLQITIMALLPQIFYKHHSLDKSYLIALQKSMLNLDLQNEVEKIHLPSLITCGSKDLPSLKSARELHKLISNSRFVIVKGGGHQLNAQKSEELANIMTLFIQNQNDSSHSHECVYAT